MDLKKKIKIGKVELEAWQLYGIGIVGVFGAYAFYKKQSAAALAVAPTETLGAGASSSTNTGAASSSGTSLDVLVSQVAANSSSIQDIAAKVTETTNLVNSNQTNTNNSINAMGKSINDIANMYTNYASNTNKAIEQVNQTFQDFSTKQATPTISKPTVFVKQGSVDENILKAEYGDKINYNYSNNGFVGVGSDRYDTNAMYDKQLASEGVTPLVNLNSEQMNRITGKAGV